MADRMPVVEQLTTACLKFVIPNNSRFHRGTPLNKLVEQIKIHACRDMRSRLKQGKDNRISDKPVLHDFSKPRSKFSFRKCLQCFSVINNDKRLMESSNEVLTLWKIDTGLSTDGRVNLGNQGSGNLHDRDAAVPRRGSEAGKITDHSTTQGYNKIAASQRHMSKRVVALL